MHYPEWLCAESSATSGSVPATSSSMRCAGWSTGATTRRGSPWSTAAALTVRRRAGWSIWRPPSRQRPGHAERAHRAGPHPVGHPRRPTDRNAHPHSDAAGKIAVVHNGIIENFASLRRELEAAGVEFSSDTDTEVAVHLVSQAVPARGDRRGLRGVGAGGAAGWRAISRWCSPTPTSRAPSWPPGAPTLVLGVGEGEMFVGSDVAAFIEHTRDAVELGQDQAVVSPPTATDHRLPRQPRRGVPAVSHRLGPERRGEGRLRVLHAQGDRRAARRGGRHAAGSFRRRPHRARRAAPVRSGVARGGQGVRGGLRHRLSLGLLAKYAIEHWTRLPVEVELASEFRYRDPVLDRSTLVVAINGPGRPPTR